MPMKQRVVDHIVGHLAAIGVDYIFGVDGANIEDLYDAAFFQSDITAVLAKHEFSAATMADGYSRSGGGLGVVAANSGVSALNLVAGLGESFTSRVPVLALVGQPETTMDGRGSDIVRKLHAGSKVLEPIGAAARGRWCPHRQKLSTQAEMLALTAGDLQGVGFAVVAGNTGRSHSGA